MPFLFLQLRPVGDKRVSWRVIDARGTESVYRDYGQAHAAIWREAYDSRSILLIEYDYRDKPIAAFKARNGEWSRLEMIVR